MALPTGDSDGSQQGGALGPEDRALWARSRRAIPWATQTNAKRRPGAMAGVMPGFFRRGKGCHLWDADDREYLDFECALGPIILGYQYPEVDQAVRRQLDEGVLFSMASPWEIEAAECLQRLVPCAARVRFLKTGGDANAACVRLARTVTGRDMIVITAYHGWQDPFAAPTHAGVPQTVRDLTIQCPFGDGDAVAEAFRRHPDRIAAVLTVPYDWEADAGAAAQYVRRLRELTRREGALLIFDEVLTGFRLSRGGGGEYFDVMPDLATFAKAIANGFPLAAFVGSEEIMEGALAQTVVSTTYAGDTVSLAAALATLGVLETQPVLQHLWTQGQVLMDGLNAIFSDRGVPAAQVGLPPRFTTLFRTGDSARDAALRGAFAAGLYRRGIFYRQAWNLSYSHSDEDIDHAVETVADVARELKL